MAIPQVLLLEIVTHVERGGKVGSFMTAVLSNDLTHAVNMAIDDNLQCIKELVQACYWEMPGPCRGSPENVRSWRQKSQAERDDVLRVNPDWERFKERLKTH